MKIICRCIFISIIRVLFTDRCGTSIETVFDQLLSNRAEVDDDLTGLDLVDLKKAQHDEIRDCTFTDP